MHRPVGPCVAPVFLRLALGITFLLAGLAKVALEIPVSGEAAATLANMGVALPPATPATPATGSAAPAVPTLPAPRETAPDAGRDAVPARVPDAADRPVPTEPLPASTPGTDPEPPAPALTALDALPRLVNVAYRPAPQGATASDYPSQVKVRQVYGMALMLKGAANPAPASGGVKPFPLWPPSLAHGAWPVYLAWTVALTELLGGVLLLAGFLTRLAAFLLAGTMLGAMWLTEVGPAVQSGTTLLGFLPDRAALDLNAWQGLLWQFTLFAGAMALSFLGSGSLGLDRVVFPDRRPAPPAPRPIAPA